MDKTKDMFYDLLLNPQLTIGDLEATNHTSENTRLFTKDYYANNQKVREMFTKEDGEFDLNKFDSAYSAASYFYQAMNSDSVNKNLLEYTTFSPDDITVDARKRTAKNSPIITVENNPTKQSFGIYEIGRRAERTQSIEELAEASEVLLNPVEVENGEEALWGDSPNDSWWGNLGKTLVLAKWDLEGYHKDSRTGENVWHEKDELKLNDSGNYYYETLDGRSIYGRQVLNKLNTLTTDGSFWNQFDFLDCDDLNQKSIAASTAKNLALVGSMFIPYVGWGIALASVGVQTTKLLATLGKMAVGSESPFLSELEGFAESFNRQNLKTEYAKEHAICWENFIDLIGDTTAQLREQRAIFKFVPAILKGKWGISDDYIKELNQKITNNLRKEAVDNLNWQELGKKLIKSGKSVEEVKMIANSNLDGIFARAAEDAVTSYMKSYNNIGEKIARAYMVGITVGDTYGEAINAGASDTEAALLTMGYAYFENKLLNTDLGNWIFPELKGEKLKYKSLYKKLAELPQEVRNSAKSFGRAEKEATKDWMKRLFNLGKEIAKEDYSLLNKTAKSVIASGLGEGLEETSEELLADFSKTCFNIVRRLRGQEAILDSFDHNWSWEDALTRYGMSFAGGVIGGGINAAATDFQTVKKYNNISTQEAMKELVWMARNGELENFWNSVKNIEIGMTNVGTDLNEDGTYAPGTKENNQDLEVKKFIYNTILKIDNIVKAEGAKFDDNGFVAQVMEASPKLKELNIGAKFRADALAKTTTAGKMLVEYNNLISDIVNIQLEIEAKQTAQDLKLTKEQEEEITELKNKLKEKHAYKESLLNGDKSLDFYRRSLFESTYALTEGFTASTEVQYAEINSGKKYTELSDKEKDSWHSKYIDYCKSEKAETMEFFADLYHNIAETTSDDLQKSFELFDSLSNNILPKLNLLYTAIEDDLFNLYEAIAKGDITEIQKVVNQLYPEGSKLYNLGQDYIEEPDMSSEKASSYVNKNESLLLLNSIADFLHSVETIATDDSESKILKALINTVGEDLKHTLSQIVTSGFVHPEIKHKINKIANSFKSNIGELNEEINNDDDDSYEYVDSFVNDLQDLLDKVNDLTYTPLQQSLQKFALNLKTGTSVREVLDYAFALETILAKNADNVSINKEMLPLFDEAIKILKMYRLAIIGARVDNADLENLFGYNKTLNDLMSGKENWKKLAEITEELANYALQDIAMAEHRLLTLKAVHDINSGNKLNTQNLAAINTELVIYKKAQRLITSLVKDDLFDNDSKQELLKIIQELDIHKLSYDDEVNKRKLVLDTISRIKFEKEALALLNALYSFFNNPKNVKILDDPKKIASIIKSYLELEEKVHSETHGFYHNNAETLTQNSESISDNAFFWWLASITANSPTDITRACVDVMDASAEKPIAPIATLELGITAALNFILNGKNFTKFTEGIKEFIYSDWTSKTPEERKQIIKDNKLNNSLSVKYREDFSEEEKTSKKSEYDAADSYAEIYECSYIPLYSNIYFIEGIAGSGKTSAVYNTILKILFKLNPDVKISDTESKKLNLFNIPFVHGTKTNAEKVIAQQIKPTADWSFNPMGKEDFMLWISSQYKDKRDPSTNTYTYIKNLDVIKEDNLWILNCKLNEYDRSEIPPVIFIDEWSHYTQPEINLINKFAKHYGISIIVGGDLSQITPTAYIKEKLSDKTYLDVTIDRNAFPRTEKLGISMRTDNGQKTHNQTKMQVIEKNNFSGNVELEFVEENGELYGDKAYRINDAPNEKQMNLIKEDIKKMMDSLKEGEKIGFIYEDTDSELYKFVNSYKDKFDFYSARDAQGNEARFYVIDNIKATSDVGDYFRTVYTGLTRSSQGSIILVPMGGVGKFLITNSSVQESEVIKDSYLEKGLKLYIENVKDIKTKALEGLPSGTLQLQRREITVNLPIVTSEPEQKALNEEVSALPKEKNEVVQLEEQREEVRQEDLHKEASLEESSLPEESEVPAELPPLYEVPDDNVAFIEPTFTETPILEYYGKYSVGTEVYDVDGNLLGKIISFEPEPNVYILDSGKPINDYDLDDPNQYIIGKTLKPQYKIGDKFVITDNSIESTIIITDIIPVGIGFEYKANVEHGNVVKENVDFSETDLNKLTKSGYSYNEEVYEIEELAKSLELDSEVNSGRIYEESVETLLENLELEELEQVLIEKDNITFTVNGYSHNTYSSGLEYVQGKATLPQKNEPGWDRIDNGVGLAKIRPSLLKNEQELSVILDKLRNLCMYGSNDVIIRELKKYLPELEDLDLSVDWYFISRPKEVSLVNADGKPSSAVKTYSRLYWDPKNKLYRIDSDEKEDLPIKTISIVIRNNTESKNILEIPLLSLSSPFTILHKLAEQTKSNSNINPDSLTYKLALLYTESMRKDMLSETIDKVMDFIEDNKANLGEGYIKLYNLCKLFKFTNWGVKKLTVDGDSFNLAAHAKNLGIKYIKRRITEQSIYDSNLKILVINTLGKEETLQLNGELAKKIYELEGNFVLQAAILQHEGYNVKEVKKIINSFKYDYSGRWGSVENMINEHPGSKFSSIMISKQLSTTGINVVRPGHPFILRVDNPIGSNLNSDDEMLEQYILLCENGYTGPQLVKLIPISMPEISIKEYLKAMDLQKENKYGNLFTVYHILSAVKNDPEFWKEITSGVSIEKKNEVENIIKELDHIKELYPQQLNQNRADYISEVTRKQKEYLQEHLEASKKLNSILFDFIKDYIFKEGELHKEFLEDIADKIQHLCNLQGLTGVLLKKEITGEAIAGYGYKLKVNSTNKYKAEDGKDFRIYRKFDSASFDLSFMLDPSSKMDYINQMAQDSAFVPVNPKNDNSPKVWKFMNGSKDMARYLDSRTSNTNNNNTERTKLLDNYETLLAELEINADNIPDSIKTREEFLNEIVKIWINKTDAENNGVGNIGIVLNDTVVYGNASKNTQGFKPLEEWKTLKQVSIEKVEEEPNHYQVTMFDKNGVEYKIDVSNDPETNKFSIMKTKGLIKPEPQQNVISEENPEEGLARALAEMDINLNREEVAKTPFTGVEQLFNLAEVILNPIAKDTINKLLEAHKNDENLTKEAIENIIKTELADSIWLATAKEAFVSVLDLDTSLDTQDDEDLASLCLTMLD